MKSLLLHVAIARRSGWLLDEILGRVVGEGCIKGGVIHVFFQRGPSMLMNHWRTRIVSKRQNETAIDRTRPRMSLCYSMGSGKGSNEDQRKKEEIRQSKAICLHAFSDLSRISPAIFVYLLKECYISGTHKATSKFRVLQQQVLQALYNKPQPGPAVFIVQCLYVLPLLGPPYTEGFSHLLLSSFRRLQTREKLSDFFEAKYLAAQLFLNILNRVVAHEERILIKLLEAFAIELKDIGQVIHNPEVTDDHLHLDAAKAYVGHYIYSFIESESYMTAVTLLEHFSICESTESSESFLSKMIQDNQFKAAEKLATLMGKPMTCLLIQKYADMNMPKNAYDLMIANDLKQDFPEVNHLYEESSLTKLAERGICESVEGRQSFLDKMLADNQFQAAEKWATLMGKQMICSLIQKYTDMNLLKKAYYMMKANDLQQEFPDVYYLYKRSSLKKFAEKGCWDVAEVKTNKDTELLEYLVYLAMEAGYTEKVDELCERYSLSGFNNVTAEPEACPLSSNYLDIKEFSLEDVSWVDKIEGLLNSTTYIEGCKVVGVDCEWKPNYVKGSKPNKVSIMQIASEKRVFIFDLLKLYDDEPKALNSCFKRILHSPKILKLGYNLQCDLRQLSHSYGDLECFRYFEMLLDIQKLFKEPRGGLSGLAEKLLGAGLNKTRRNSNWEQRPLTQNQIEYAALDAVVLVHIFHHIHSQPQAPGFQEEKSKIEWKSHIVSHTGNTKKPKKKAS